MKSSDSMKNLIAEELTERREEGCDTERIRQSFVSCGDDCDKLNSIYRELTELEVSAEFPYYEPNSLDEIIRCSPGGFEPSVGKVSEDKFFGAWLGRCIGCALGKPFEASPFTGGRDGVPGYKFIYEWYKGADAYPIDNYAPSASRAEKQLDIRLERGSAPCYRENIAFMQTDDDIRFMVIALKLLEKKGLGFTLKDVSDNWRGNLTAGMVFTAEYRAYVNSLIANEFYDECDEKYEFIRMNKNPYREWIGAQIRIDVYAYVCAGNPQKAAELAYRDACYSHVKNGVYGAMFCAAMIAAAFTEKSAERVLDAGLSVIPQGSRLFHAVNTARVIAEGAKSELELAEKINREFGNYHSIHSINNTALCAAAVAFGKGDFEKSITAAVLGGWDTDCNGATVGSVLGAVNGVGAIPKKWSAPLNDTLYSSIPDFHPIKISECAKRTYRIWQSEHSR